MVGLGETREELEETLRDLQAVGCRVVTIGQYLRPTPAQVPVVRFWAPAEFAALEAFGRSIGLEVIAGPFVRSSYHAEEAFLKASRPPSAGAVRLEEKEETEEGGRCRRGVLAPISCAEAARGLARVQPVTGEKLRSYGLAAGAGAALALALPGPALWPLVLVAPGPAAASDRRARRGWPAFRVGWFGGLVQWLVAVPWVVIVLSRHGHLPLPLAVLALLLMTAILGLQWGLAAWAAARTGARWIPWTLPLALAAVELLQRFPPWIFPWNPVAAVATAAPALMTPLPVLGGAGLSLLLLLAGSGVGELAAPALAHGRCAGVGVGRCVRARDRCCRRRSGRPGSRCGRQRCSPTCRSRCAGTPPTSRRSRSGCGGSTARRRTPAPAGSSGRKAPSPATWSVTRSTAGPSSRWRAPHAAWLVVGSIGFAEDGESYFNSVFVFAPGGRVPWRYDKVHLVPFGEYVPLAGQLSFLRPLVREVGSFTPGRSALPLPGPAGPVGLAVCYEVTYPGLIAEQVRNGAARPRDDHQRRLVRRLGGAAPAPGAGAAPRGREPALARAGGEHRDLGDRRSLRPGRGTARDGARGHGGRGGSGRRRCHARRALRCGHQARDRRPGPRCYTRRRPAPPADP